MRYLSFLLFVFLIFSCKDSKKTDYSKKAEVKTQRQTHPGEKLMKLQCNTCHSSTASHDGRIAPPMIAVKKHYHNEVTTKEDFIKEMVAFTLNPSEDKAKMRGAVRRFGVMPKQLFKEEEVKLIAEYLYENEIDQPDWFQKHWEERGKGKEKGMHHGKQEGQQGKESKKQIGYGIALKTKQELAKNLIGSLQKDGSLAALKFCNVEAYPITNRMSQQLEATIKRVSDKARNPENTTSEKETTMIAMFQAYLDKGESYEPIVEKLANGKTKFYAPIVTNQMCLQCHGNPQKDINPATLTAIKELYPKDKAIGYDVNQVRGLWSISF